MLFCCFFKQTTAYEMRISDWSADVCSSDLPGIQALFAQQATDGATQEYTQAGNNLYSPNGGNLDLKEETADTLTLGAVLAPRFAQGLTIAVDYYDIRTQDATAANSNRDNQLQSYETHQPHPYNPLRSHLQKRS